MRVEARSKPIIANAWVDRKTNARARAADAAPSFHDATRTRTWCVATLDGADDANDFDARGTRDDGARARANARADGDDGDARRGVSPIAGRRAIATGRRARAERGADARARTWGMF
jgi:hypothetical protein